MIRPPAAGCWWAEGPASAVMLLVGWGISQVILLGLAATSDGPQYPTMAIALGEAFSCRRGMQCCQGTRSDGHL